MTSNDILILSSRSQTPLYASKYCWQFLCSDTELGAVIETLVHGISFRVLVGNTVRQERGGGGLVGRSLGTCRCLHLDPLEVVVTHLKSRSSRSLSLSCFSGCWIHLEVLWREREEEEEELQWSDKPVKIRHLFLSVQVCWLILTPPTPTGLEEATGPRNGHISREPRGTLV